MYIIEPFLNIALLTTDHIELQVTFKKFDKHTWAGRDEITLGSHLTISTSHKISDILIESSWIGMYILCILEQLHEHAVRLGYRNQNALQPLCINDGTKNIRIAIKMFQAYA